ncbi:uncharacterized protein LOC132184052 [Corylus avellana]|uniref:uncharacterized protein LOC132184052 n=1 Tax=Corylus avellana TaxID=13451 RepID=UPI00286D6908|nr:uncharacterized protein LOC132184052 [Corylus avellana]
MERVFLTCFPPLCRGKPSSSTNVNIDESVTLFSSLVSDIDTLQTWLLPEGSISLQWCSEATNLLRKMHSQLLLFYQKSEIPSSWDCINILDVYMKETFNLLDLCNSLNSAISRMGRYRLTVDLAVRKFCDDEIPDVAAIKAEIERLETESKKICGVEKRKYKNMFKTAAMAETKSKNRHHHHDSTIRFIYAVKSTIDVMGMLLFSAILYPVSDVGEYEEVYRWFPQLKFFSASLGKLVGCCLKGKDCTRSVLVENMVIEKAVLDIKEEVLKGEEGVDLERLRKSIDLLKRSSSALKESMEMFEAVVKELFAEVENGRDKLLAMVVNGK